jgi:hypothetical protein
MGSRQFYTISHIYLRRNLEKFREILRYFCCDETANKTLVYINISKNTINKIFR